MQAAEAAVRAGVQSGGGAALPGIIFNQSKKVTYTDAVSGLERSVYAGRMECTMQVWPQPVFFAIKTAAWLSDVLLCGMNKRLDRLCGKFHADLHSAWRCRTWCMPCR